MDRNRWAATVAVTAAAVVVMTVAATGCVGGDPRFSAIKGRVTQSPCGQPVIEGQPPCPDPPVVAPIEVYDAQGVIVARTRTDDRGFYATGLPIRASGRYTVKVVIPAPPPWCPDGAGDVAPGRTTTVDILCGSGAR
jgi:hypothetical protein